MLKRVEIGGFIEIPEGAELPELDQIVTVSELRVQVTGKHEDKQKRRGDYATEGLDPRARVRLALGAAERFSTYVRRPFVIRKGP